MSTYHKLSYTLLSASTLLALSLIAAPTPALAQSTNVSSATQTTTAKDTTNLTVGEAFTHDSVLKKAVCDSFNVNADSPLSAIDHDKGLGKTLDITNPGISTFKDLHYLKGSYSRLMITNQPALSTDENFGYLLDLLKVDPEKSNFIADLGLMNDNLNDANFSDLCKVLKNQPVVYDHEDSESFQAVTSLNVSHNKISDFSPLESIFNFQSAETNKLDTFTGFSQHPDQIREVPTATVANNTIHLNPKDFDAYNLYLIDAMGRKESTKIQTEGSLSADFYYRPYKNDIDATDTLSSTDPETSVLGWIGDDALKMDLTYGLSNVERHLDKKEYALADRFNSLDYLSNTYQNVASPDYIKDTQSQLSAQGFKSTDGTELTGDTNLYDIPSGTKSVRLRTIFYEHIGSGFDTGYTQDYEIPLNWSSSTNASTDSSTSTSTSPDFSDGGAADTVSPKGTVVYATKKIGLYNGTNFTKKGRQHWYRKQPRINRPMFKVTGYANSTTGRPRYLVKDVNHHSKTAGDEGYITTQAAYVAPVYYRKAAKKITVINPNGVNAYRNKSLTGKATHYRQGQTLRVKKLVKHNLTTRYVLTNGRYITANKKLVQNGQIATPKKLKAKTAINRYRDVNFTHRQKHYRKSTTLTVKGWDFSAHGTMRYRVAHGYVTANRHFIKTIH